MRAWHLPDGRQIAFREAGAGRPLLLLHGWAMSSAVFAEVIPPLAQRWRVLAPDLPGHGASAPTADFSLAALAADLGSWLASLSVERTALLGWSLGGMLGLQLAIDHPQLVEQLILVGTTPRFVAAPEWPAGLPDGQVRAMGRDLARNYELTMSAFFQLMFQGEELSAERRRQIAGFAVHPGGLPRPETAQAGLALLRALDLRQDLGRVVAPALVEHGALDAITPVAAGRSLASSLVSARLVEHPDCGHAPFLSRPERSLALWQDFLA